MIKYRRSLKQGGKLPDHDPNNPYHYHDSNGNKIVIIPEEWEENVGKPYFREIEAAVKAEQAAHPEPEYEVNSDFVRGLRSTYQYNMGRGYQNYKNFGASLPQGYSFTNEGLIVDPQDNYYVQSGYRQSPRFTYSTDNPLSFTINKGKLIERNLTFYPVNMEKKLKKPLPVDRTLNVNSALETAINKYQKENARTYTPVTYKYKAPILMDGFSTTTINGKAPSTGSSYIYIYNPDINEYGFTPSSTRYVNNITREQHEQRIADFNEMVDEENVRKAFMFAEQAMTGSNWNKEAYETFKQRYPGGVEEYLNNPKNKIPVYGTEKTFKPSRKEAEKKAVITIGPLEKVGTKRRRLESSGQISD